MILDIIAWTAFGALIGWIASLIMGSNEEQGGIENIIIGIVGAFIGGLLVTMFGTEVSGFNLNGLLAAILGAMILITVLRLFNRGSTTAHR